MRPFEKPIMVTRPFLPPLEEFAGGLREIWDNAWLTNRGPLERRFTDRLCDTFGTQNVCLFNNGTLALQIALQGMGITGEVITTPFTFVATTHALYWNKIRPVFCDIEPNSYTLDPDCVEASITPWTSAILAVHVFGRPCRLEALAAIARRHRLRLIYDAAHAFAVNVNGRPISAYGDLSMFSFHATKLFHSVEGGALVFQDPGLKATFEYLKNFGFKNEVEVVMPGTNAKMNEFQALMGLQLLDYMPRILANRRAVDAAYRTCLADIPGIRVPALPSDGVEYNFAYFPVEVDEATFGLSRDGLYEALKRYNVFSRRYFYPLLTEFACFRHVSVIDPLRVARGVADRILTLPIYDSLAIEDVERIAAIVAHLGAEAKDAPSRTRKEPIAAA